jgi:hypothetical protein
METRSYIQLCTTPPCKTQASSRISPSRDQLQSEACKFTTPFMLVRANAKQAAQATAATVYLSNNDKYVLTYDIFRVKMEFVVSES